MKGFTLAEILITIGIIGVVSAITIPTLIKNYQKHQIEVGLKRSYALMNQAIKLSVAENGDIGNWKFPVAYNEDNAVESAHEFVKTYIFPYIKVANDCTLKDGCWANPDYLMSGTPSAFAYRTELANNNFVKFSILDGTNVAVYPYGEAISFYIDVNAGKNPNTRGKDIFEFILDKTKNEQILLPKGYDVEIKEAKRVCERSGFTCAAIIMNNGWKFPKDYPW